MAAQRVGGSVVVVVEDDAATSDVLREALADEGYAVLTAGDGEQALALLARHGHPAPAVVLLDVRMPHLDGWGFLRAYRATPGPHAAVVVLTAGPLWADGGDWGGVDAAVAKPFDLDCLLRLVAAHAGTPPSAGGCAGRAVRERSSAAGPAGPTGGAYGG